MTVAVVNFKVDACNKESNLSRICGYAEAAAKRGADLVLLVLDWSSSPSAALTVVTTEKQKKVNAMNTAITMATSLVVLVLVIMCLLCVSEDRILQLTVYLFPFPNTMQKCYIYKRESRRNDYDPGYCSPLFR